jgi:cell division protein FtsN
MINHRKNMRGGTLLGLIIGLIIGLAIAVGVAMTIKNTPLPFTNKLGKQDKPAEPVAGQAADPNKPLYGNREAAKEAAKDFAKKMEEGKAAEVQADAKKEGTNKPDSTQTAKVDGKPPVIDKSTPEKAQKADAGDEKWTYYLQAGAFLEQADAENAKAKLALMGFAASIAERQSDNGILYRVRIGPFGQLETMNRVRTKLSDNGVDVAVVRVPK